ncbi:MAG: hypothetical protein U0798_16685 [Gemmataceae bacterium]
MQITTKKCSQFQHREFKLDLDEYGIPESYLENIAGTIEHLVESGSVFLPDQIFLIGGMTTRIQNYNEEFLTLHEPDMVHFPIQWRPGLSNTLRLMMRQLFSLDSFSLRANALFPSILQSLLVCKHYHEANFFMHRTEPSNERDSGWFIGCLKADCDHNDPNNIECLSVYAAYLKQNRIQNFTAFPTGSMIVIDQIKGLSVFKEDNQLQVLPESFLSQLFDHNRDKD